MAEGLDQKEKGLEDLEQEITCFICSERFQDGSRDPKLLPCGHCYCKSCVRQLAAREHPFPCPECRTNTFLPQNDLDRLPTLFLLNRIKDAHAKLEQGKLEVVCEACGKAIAESFCRQCAEFICKECKQSHERMKLKFAGHEVITLEELRKGGAKPIPRKQAPPPTCKEHDEPLKLFCFDCDYLICRDCLIDNHSGHKREFVKKAAPNCKRMLKQSLTPLTKISAEITEATKQVEAVEKEVSDQSASVAGAIHESFNHLHEILHEHEKELISKTSRLLQQKVNALQFQKKSFQTAIVEILSLAELVERNLESATDEELMSLHKPILARLEDEGKKHSQLSLKPVEIANITAHIHCAEHLTKICRNNAKVCLCLADPSRCKAEGHGIESAEVYKLTRFIVRTTCPDDNPCTETQFIEAKLKSLSDGSVVQCEVCEKEGGVYEVSYTPKTRGRHSLTVTVNGKEITGSPFRVFVKIHPTQLDEPVRTITGVNQPWGIVINSEQQLLVAEKGKVGVLDKHGKRLRTIECDKYRGPCGVATDRDNNVYVTDCYLNTVVKFNKDGKLLKAVGSQGKGPKQFDSPGMIRIIDDRLYVCDRNNARVQILKFDLQFERRFGLEGSRNGEISNLQDIAQDSRGNLYIADFNNLRIQVFDRDGHFLRVFAEKGSSSKPCGLCFDSNHFLFVTECRSNCVSVFKPTGEFVTSFGQVRLPAGIAIDEDGFVYVCEHRYGCNKIYVF